MEFTVCFIVKGYAHFQNSVQKNGLLNAGKKPVSVISIVYHFLRVRLLPYIRMHSRKEIIIKKEVGYVYGL